MAKLDSLIVDLQLNSAALRSGLNEAKGALANFGDSIKGIDDKLKALSEAKSFEIGKEVVKGLTEFVMKGAEAADQMGKLAQSAGVPVEVLSRLDYAASLSGVSTEELGKAFTHLNTGLAKAGAGVAEQSSLFAALGISVKDASGHVRSGGDAMNALAARFAGLSDGASKSALAVEVFGHSGDKLLPLLNQGPEGLKKLGDEADRLGITITAGAAKSTDEFTGNMEKLEHAARAVGSQVAAQLAPALTNLTNQLISSKDAAEQLKGVADSLAAAMRILGSGGLIVGSVFDTLGRLIGSAGAKISAALEGNFKRVAEVDDEVVGDIKGVWAGLATNLHALWGKDTGAEEALKKQDDAVKKSADAVQTHFESMKKAAVAYGESLKALTKVAQEYEAKFASFGKGPIALLEAELDTGKFSQQLKALGKDAADMRDRILEAAKGLHELDLEKLEGSSKFERGRAETSLGHQVDQRTKDFNNVGANRSDVLEQLRGSFKSFDAALSSYAQHTIASQRLMDQAAVFRANGDEAAARQATVLADAEAYAATQASNAASSFEESAQKLHDSVVSGVGTLASKMGDVGDIINGALQGFASGGPIGAIIGIIVAVVVKLEGFMRMVASMNDFFGRALGNLNTSLKPLFDNLIYLAETIGRLIEDITKASGSFEILTLILDFVGLVLWAVAKAIGFAELTILKTGQLILAMFGGHDSNLDAKIKEVQAHLDEGFGYEKPAKDLGDGLNKLGDEVKKTTDKFSEMLTNIPTGYKVGGAVFGATDSPGKSSGGGGHGYGWSGDGLEGLQQAISNTTDPDTVAQWDASLGNNILGGKDYSGAAGNYAGWGSGSGSTGTTGGTEWWDYATMWLNAYTAALKSGLSDDQARAAADGVVAAAKADAAAASTPKYSQIPGSFGVPSDGASDDSGSAHFHGPVFNGPVTVMPRNFTAFVAEVSEAQDKDGSRRRRNTYRAKK